jgi:hypothetical protein
MTERRAYPQGALEIASTQQRAVCTARQAARCGNQYLTALADVNQL